MNTREQVNKRLLHRELTGQIINAAIEVHKAIGCGLFEKLYGNGLAHELRLRNLNVVAQREFDVIYKGQSLGLYYADLVVDGKVIVEVKAVEELTNVHRAQLLNYLRISGIRVGLLINFAKQRLQCERFAV
jgi:GxxExxY protein